MTYTFNFENMSTGQREYVVDLVSGKWGVPGRVMEDASGNRVLSIGDEQMPKLLKQLSSLQHLMTPVRPVPRRTGPQLHLKR